MRVVEGIFRRPFGLAALTVEITGYADEASAARTLFPLVRVRDVRAFLDEFLPELADDPSGLEPPPPRAYRRYLLLPTLLGLAVTVGAWFVVGPYAIVALIFGLAYGQARWRAAAWRLADGRLAVRSMLLARTTVLAPAALPRVPHPRPELLPAPRRPRRPRGRLRQADHRPHPPPRGHRRAGGLVGPLNKDALDPLYINGVRASLKSRRDGARLGRTV